MINFIRKKRLHGFPENFINRYAIFIDISHTGSFRLSQKIDSKVSSLGDSFQDFEFYFKKIVQLFQSLE